jgi:hypothetical protein
MTFTLKSAALPAAIASLLIAGAAANAGSIPVDSTPPEPPPSLPAAVAVPPAAVATIAAFAEAAGLGELGEALADAEPGSPEATAAVLSIVTALSEAPLPALTPTQAAAARSAIEKIIAETGGSPALTTLLGRL